MHLFPKGAGGRTSISSRAPAGLIQAKDHLGKSLLWGFILDPVSLIVSAAPARSEAVRGPLCYDAHETDDLLSRNRIQLGEAGEWGGNELLESVARLSFPARWAGCLIAAEAGGRERVEPVQQTRLGCAHLCRSRGHSGDLQNLRWQVTRV